MQNAHQNTHKQNNCIKAKQYIKTKVIDSTKKGEFAGDIATSDR